MMRKFIAMFATIAFAMATFTATPANAQRWRDRGDYGDYAGCRDDNNYGCERDRDRREARNGYDGYGYGDRDYDRRGRGYYNRPECYDRQGRNHCYDRHDDDDDDAVAAGVIGLVLGAVIGSAVANSNNQRRDDGYYNDRNGYQHCTQQVRRWDRRQGRYVIVDVPC